MSHKHLPLLLSRQREWSYHLRSHLSWPVSYGKNPLLIFIISVDFAPLSTNHPCLSLLPQVQLVEVTFSQPSLTALLSGSASALVQLSGLAGREARISAVRSLMLDALVPDGPLRAMMGGAGGGGTPSDDIGAGGGSLGSMDAGAAFSPLGVSLLAPEISVEGVGCRVGQSGEATSASAAPLIQVAALVSGALSTGIEEGKK